MGEYEIYDEVSKKVLDSVQVGDLVKFNDWAAAYRVKGVSENYFVAARKMFGQVGYTICEKKRWPGIRYNAMRGGMYHIGPDNLIFGWPEGYDFDNEEVMERYLRALETERIAISERRGCPVYRIEIKRVQSCE